MIFTDFYWCCCHAFGLCLFFIDLCWFCWFFCPVASPEDAVLSSPMARGGTNKTHKSNTNQRKNNTNQRQGNTTNKTQWKSIEI